MASTPPSEVVYEGEVLHADFNADNLDGLEAELQEFLDIGEDEELHVSVEGDDRLVVQTLRRVDD